ncbi:helicase associated domain-containing protein [Streptomyces djakartensis]|uniref:helicase associated domain-containing protein n=1 Tax=Streptomyces djakartensis TaxID=68193 RepID=UPI0034E05470
MEPEHANWKAGHRTAVAFFVREGHLNVSYHHVEGGPAGAPAAFQGGGFPLGRWLSDQRRAMRAGGLATERAEDLEALEIVWEPGDEAWEENLAAARAYFDVYGTLAAPVTAAMEDKPVGQWLANACKKGGLGNGLCGRGWRDGFGGHESGGGGARGIG